MTERYMEKTTPYAHGASTATQPEHNATAFAACINFGIYGAGRILTWPNLCCSLPCSRHVAAGVLSFNHRHCQKHGVAVVPKTMAHEYRNALSLQGGQVSYGTQQQ